MKKSSIQILILGRKISNEVTKGLGTNVGPNETNGAKEAQLNEKKFQIPIWRGWGNETFQFPKLW